MVEGRPARAGLVELRPGRGLHLGAGDLPRRDRVRAVADAVPRRRLAGVLAQPSAPGRALRSRHRLTAGSAAWRCPRGRCAGPWLPVDVRGRGRTRRYATGAVGAEARVAGAGRSTTLGGMRAVSYSATGRPRPSDLAGPGLPRRRGRGAGRRHRACAARTGTRGGATTRCRCRTSRPRARRRRWPPSGGGARLGRRRPGHRAVRVRLRPLLVVRGRRHPGVPRPDPAGLHRAGSFAEQVALHAADTNLVRLPDGLDFVTAASLGCRLATAYRALVTHGRVRAGDWVAVHGCGGVGLSAVMVAVALGARVVAVDVSPGCAGSGPRELGADATVSAPTTPAAEVRDADRRRRARLPRRRRVAGHRRRIGPRPAPSRRHVQVGLLLGAPATPPLPMDLVVARELSSPRLARHAGARSTPTCSPWSRRRRARPRPPGRAGRSGSTRRAPRSPRWSEPADVGRDDRRPDGLTRGPWAECRG